ncbi:MAG: acyl--CoA ligase [Acidobacteria bacterium]|nr:acyl--CoA ligase [Acidobacteriota bacterium]
MFQEKSTSLIGIIERYPKLIDQIIPWAQTFYPEKEAVVTPLVRLTYSELEGLIRFYARGLREKGCQPKDRVVLLLENSSEYIIAFFSILRAAAIVVPLNINLQQKNLHAILHEVKPRFIITRPALRRRFQGMAQLDESSILTDFFGHTNAEVGRLAQEQGTDTNGHDRRRVDKDPAVLIYTSGTSGHPKGVLLSHHNIISNAVSNLCALRFTDTDRTLICLPMTYCYTIVNQMISHLFVGGTLVIGGSVFMASGFLRNVEREKITTFSATPATYEILLRSSGIAQSDISSLRLFTIGGEKVSPVSLGKLKKAFPGVSMAVTYGLTEGGPRISTLHVDSLGKKSRSVGKANPNILVEIVDEAGNALPSNQVGEIAIYGSNVMIGYYPHHKHSVPLTESGFLRTGDYGWMDEEGNIHINGRKHIINTGGEKVSIHEVEDTLLDSGLISDGIIVPTKDRIKGTVLKAIVVPKDAQVFSVDSLRRHCTEKLEKYKVPKSFMVVNSIALGLNAKKKRAV